MGETNSPSVAHVGYDISALSRVKLKMFSHSSDGLWLKFKFYSLEWSNIVTHGQLKENLYILLQNVTSFFLLICLCTQMRRCVNGSYATEYIIIWTSNLISVSILYRYYILYFSKIIFFIIYTSGCWQDKLSFLILTIYL
jgi:hypothetical protein